MENLKALSSAEIEDISGGLSLIPIPVGGLGAIIFQILSIEDAAEGYKDATS